MFYLLSMRFNEYLVYYQQKHKLKSATSLYNFLGGKKSLDITLRNFSQIYTNDRHPSLKVFLKILQQLPLDEYKQALLTFFETFDTPKSNSKNLIDYLVKHLSVAIDKSKPDVWDLPLKTHVLNDNQLKYLNNNPEALRFFNLLLLKEKLNIKFFKNKEPIIKELESLGLLKLRKNGNIDRPYDLLRVPTPQNAPRALAHAGLDYIYSHIHNYSSSETSDSQKVCYSIQTINKEHLPIIMEHLNNTHKWINSLAELEEHKDELIPLVFVAFSRGLSWEDF